MKLRSHCHVIATIITLLVLRVTCVATEILFDNGSFSDIQNARYNSIVANVARNQFRMFDDFVLDQAVIVTGFSWKQHDNFDTTYISTEITIYSDIPSDNSLLHARTKYALRRRNNTSFPFWGSTGYDYSVDGLFLQLTPGHYWLGLNSNTVANYAYGTTTWDMSVGNSSTLRGRYQTEHMYPDVLPGGYHLEEDSVFQVVGYIVPELSTFFLAAIAMLSLMMVSWRRQV